MSVSRGGADIASLAERVGAALGAHAGWSGEPELRPLTGGTSGLTYFSESQQRGVSEAIVVKVAPAGLKPVGHRDVLRQARLLVSLGASGVVPVPTILAEDAGRGSAEPPLFVMQFTDGTAWEPLHDPADPLPPAAQTAARLRQAARLLARMHGLDTAKLPSETATTLEAELDRWTRAYRSTDLGTAIFARCEQTLRRTLPKPAAPALVHGDWRLGNMLCRDEEILAVIDWEIWSIGDPRMDIGWFDITTDPAHPRAIRAPYWTMAPEELHDEYASVRDRPTDIAWFDAFAKFKQAAITTLQAKHQRRRDVSAADELAELAVRLLDWALA